MVRALRNSDMFFFVTVTDHLVCVNQQIKGGGNKRNTGKLDLIYCQINEESDRDRIHFRE